VDIVTEIKVFLLPFPLFLLLLKQFLLLLLLLLGLFPSAVIHSVVSWLHYSVLLDHLLDNCEVSATNFLVEISFIYLSHGMSPSLNNGTCRKRS